MIKQNRHIILHSLILLALITASISPACKFISGQSNLLEICTIWGTKTVPVPVGQYPSTPAKSDHRAAADSCMFCMAVQIQKALPLSVFDVNIKALAQEKELPLYVGFYSERILLTYQARAPPQLS